MLTSVTIGLFTNQQRQRHLTAFNYLDRSFVVINEEQAEKIILYAAMLLQQHVQHVAGSLKYSSALQCALQKFPIVSNWLTASLLGNGLSWPADVALKLYIDELMCCDAFLGTSGTSIPDLAAIPKRMGGLAAFMAAVPAFPDLGTHHDV